MAGEDLFVLFSPIPPGISLAGEDLFVHFSNIVGGNALVQDGQVEFVKVYDERKVRIGLGPGFG